MPRQFGLQYSSRPLLPTNEKTTDAAEKGRKEKRDDKDDFYKKQGLIIGHRAAQSAEYKILLIYLTHLRIRGQHRL